MLNLACLRLSVVLAGTLLLFSCAPDDTAQTPRVLRVMSYNMAAGYGDLDRIAEAIRSQEPDIVALQEVDVHWGERSNYEDQARLLGEALNMNVFFGPIYTLPAGEEANRPRAYGLAFLSREPIVYEKNHEITRLSTLVDASEPEALPGFLEIAIGFDGRRIHLFNTHLDYRTDPSVRRAQVAEMIDVTGRFNRPVLLLGDLNARPYAEELQSLFARLDDVWAGHEDPGYTFPADAPDRRIDYILHSAHFEVKQAFVVATSASDHTPVVADLALVQGEQ